MTRAVSPEDVRHKLRSAGLRATAPRVAVLRFLVGANGAVTHAEVAAALSGVLDRATAYRNLMDLTEAGLVRRTDMGDHVWRFEPVERRHGESAHPHFICGSCGTVTCLPEDAVSVRVPRGAPRALRRAKGVLVQLRGLCDACL